MSNETERRQRCNMTKQIRIENADTSNHKVIIEVWEKTKDGDILVNSYNLDLPTQMITETIWSNRYIVIKEV